VFLLEGYEFYHIQLIYGYVLTVVPA
jgi:hypothetical protein